jgi:hypothetical protein
MELRHESFPTIDKPAERIASRRNREVESAASHAMSRSFEVLRASGNVLFPLFPKDGCIFYRPYLLRLTAPLSLLPWLILERAVCRA